MRTVMEACPDRHKYEAKRQPKVRAVKDHNCRHHKK